MVLLLLNFQDDDGKAWIVIKETEQERDERTGLKFRAYEGGDIDNDNPFATGGGKEIMRLYPSAELWDWIVKYRDRVDAGDVNVFLEYKHRYPEKVDR